MPNNQKQDENSTLKKFLSFLDEDMKKNPQNIKPISSDLLKRIQSLVADVDFDLNAPLSEDDE
ncbi:type II toxin-antitoxin system PrlF family antitoxin [Calothrix sp. CCY 0018]|uniref:type II toxin-antitoxin system PrlF family antitoxin n=1 Tax=Calothrix sp. CCY 0018 TaxID=3103864 RepID=UPI0039C69945